MKIDNIDYSFSEVTSLATLNSAKELNIKNSVLIDLIYKINDGLIQYQTNMGHRSIFEMAHYINNYIEITDISFAKDSLDFQFCQKLIPKLMGSDERIEKSILHTVKIITNNEIDNGDKFLANNLKGLSYPKTLNKLQRMYKYYMQNGFVNFANV